MANCEIRLSGTKCIVVFVGLPGSGKTTLARKLCERLERIDNSNVKLLSFDDIVPLKEQAKFVSSESMKDSRKALFDLTDNCISKTENLTILIDDNNYYRSMRYEYYRLAAKYRIGFCLVYLKCEIDAALRNNAKRPSSEQVPADVIHKMAERLEPPTEKWERYVLCLRFNETEEKLNDVWKLIQGAHNDPILIHDILEFQNQQRETSRLICSKSTIHIADQFLRKTIKAILSENTADVKTIAPILNQGRKTLLQKIKNQEVLLEHEEDMERYLTLLLRDLTINKTGET